MDVEKADHPNLHLASTRELLEELLARGEAMPIGTNAELLKTGAWDLLCGLSPALLDSEGT